MQRMLYLHTLLDWQTGQNKVNKNSTSFESLLNAID